MNKFDTLLKRSEALYKLAIFSDRKTFLQSLGQNNQLQSLFDQAAKLINDNGGNVSDLSAIFNKNPNDLAKYLEENANFIAPSLSNPNVKLQVHDIATKIRNLNNTPVATNLPVSNKDQSPSIIPINTKDQQLLSSYITENGLGLPLQIDGKLGPKTREAFNAFKKSINAPQMSDQEAIEWLQTLNLKQSLNS